MSNNKNLTIFIFRIFPKGLFSRILGAFMDLRYPEPIRQRINDWACKKWGLNTDETAHPEEGFKTLNQYFTRKLKDGIHIIDKSKKSIVSPVDGYIQEYGDINNTSIIQAKGVDYPLDSLVPSDMHKEFINGSFITIYLTPADYHRIHAPIGGRICGYYVLPGKLFPVREYMVEGLKGLYSKNERLITYLKTASGPVAVCKIGAMNVGKITVVYDDIRTRKFLQGRKEHLYPESEQKAVKKGEELGTFHLGSTVILLFPEGMISLEKLKKGSKIRLGSKIAVLNK